MQHTPQQARPRTTASPTTEQQQQQQIKALPDQSSISAITTNSSAEVDKVSAHAKSKGNRSCLHCGNDHTSADCKARYAKCYRCRKRGHLSTVCALPHNHNNGSQIHAVDGVDDDDQEHHIGFLSAIEVEQDQD
jgi:hypothetical protein